MAERLTSERVELEAYCGAVLAAPLLLAALLTYWFWGFSEYVPSFMTDLAWLYVPFAIVAPFMFAGVAGCLLLAVARLRRLGPTVLIAMLLTVLSGVALRRLHDVVGPLGP